MPADATNNEDNISLFAMVGTTSIVGSALSLIHEYIWNIKIEQIDCTENNEREGRIVPSIDILSLDRTRTLKFQISKTVLLTELKLFETCLKLYGESIPNFSQFG